jgi:predicted esterase
VHAVALVALAQSGYFDVTGVWPLVSMRSVARVTGPKTDRWLVKTVGALVGVIGSVLALAGLRGRRSQEVALLCAGSALSVDEVDTVYAQRGRIAPIFLLAAAEQGLAGAWQRPGHWGTAVRSGTEQCWHRWGSARSEWSGWSAWSKWKETRAMRGMATPKCIEIPVAGERTDGIITEVANAPGGVVMVGGASGGMYGPSGVYEDLAARMADRYLAALRLEYRRTSRITPCMEDTLAGVDLLAGRGVPRVVLIGWSFGGAVVITAGAMSRVVVGVATVASQTHGTELVSRVAPRRLLLIHGTADEVLSDRCSRQLYAQAREPKELVLFEGDGHGIERHRAELLRKLDDWCAATLLDTDVSSGASQVIVP